jgi:hypothetical protein
MAEELVVAFRTHRWNRDIAVLARRLAYYSQGATFVVLADETDGVLETGHFRKLAHSKDFSAFGLPAFPPGRPLWWNSDYPLYLLRREFPEATHFAMVEYDVAVNTDAAAILRDARDRAVDLIGVNLVPATAKWAWYDTVSKHFTEPMLSFLPFMVISARAIDALLRSRLNIFAAHPPAARGDWPFAEGLIPSVVASLQGARMEELARHASLPFYDFRWHRHLQDPTVTQTGTICHPVVGEDAIRLRLEHEKPEAVLDPQSELRRQLRFCDPQVFAPELYEVLRAKGTPERLRRYVALARAQNWPLPEAAGLAEQKKYLVILRAGAGSLHPAWLQGEAAPVFDLVLCPYEDIPLDPAAFWQSGTIAGQKWTGLHRLLAEWPDWRRYDYIWLPDDDLATGCDTINALFTLSARFGAALSAPSLSENSHFSHPITMHNRNFFARAVSFIEVMMPCFRRDALELLLPSLGMTETGYGWGLDSVWPGLLQYKDVIIFDHLTVHHTRPLGAMRDHSKLTEIQAEMTRVMSYYRTPATQKVLGVYDEAGTYREAGSAFLAEYLDGYGYLFERSPRLLQLLSERQSAELPLVPLPAAALAALPGRDRVNLALGKPALVSSVWRSWPEQDPARAAAGANNGMITGAGAFHTEHEADPWWQVDLGDVYAVDRVMIYNRFDRRERCTRLAVSGCFDGLDWHILGVKLDAKLFGGADGTPHVFDFDPPFTTRFVRITLIGENFLHLDEVEVYGAAA